MAAIRVETLAGDCCCIMLCWYHPPLLSLAISSLRCEEESWYNLCCVIVIYVADWGVPNLSPFSMDGEGRDFTPLKPRFEYQASCISSLLLLLIMQVSHFQFEKSCVEISIVTLKIRQMYEWNNVLFWSSFFTDSDTDAANRPNSDWVKPSFCGHESTYGAV